MARVVTNGLKLDGPVALPAFDIEASIGPGGRASLIKLSGERLNGLITPRDKVVGFDVTMTTFTPPFAPKLTIVEFGMKGSADAQSMTVSSFDGRLLDGRDGNAGHIGHVIVEPDGRACGCGARGCLEAQASGLAIEAATGRPPKDASPELVAQVGRWVGRAVASVCSLLDLRLALVAGSVALGYGDAFFVAAQAELSERARISFVEGAEVRRAGLGDEGPLIGAAAVARRGGRVRLDAPVPVPEVTGHPGQI